MKLINIKVLNYHLLSIYGVNLVISIQSELSLSDANPRF